MKRIISFILAAALVIGLMPAIAFAADGDIFSVNFYDWTEYTGSNQYLSATSKGSNWMVDAALSDAKQISGSKDGGAARVQISNTTTFEGFKFITVNKASGDLAIKFTAPKNGTYKMNAIVVPYSSNGKVTDIYLNGVKIGTIDSYMSGTNASLATTRTIDLGTISLKAGEYENSLVIKVTDSQAFIEGFMFEEIASDPKEILFNFHNELKVKPSNTDPKEDRLAPADTTGDNFITIVEESNSNQTGDHRVYTAGGKKYPQFDLGKGAASTWISSKNDKERKWTFKIKLAAAGWYDVYFLGGYWYANDIFYLYVGDKFAGIYDFTGGNKKADSSAMTLGINKKMNTLYLTPDADGYVKIMLAYAKHWEYGQARMAPIELNIKPATAEAKCVDIVHTLPETMEYGEMANFEAYALMSDGSRRSFNGYTSVATPDANNGISVKGATSDITVARTSDPLFDEGLYAGTVSANAIGAQKVVLSAMIDGVEYKEEATINVTSKNQVVTFKLGFVGDDLTYADNSEPKDWNVSGAEIVADKSVSGVTSRRYTYAWGTVSQMTTEGGNKVWPNYTADKKQTQITFKKTVPAAGIYDVTFEGFSWSATAEYAIYVNGEFVGNTNCYDASSALDGASKKVTLNRIELPEGAVEISFRARKAHYTGAMFFTPKELIFTPTDGDIKISEVKTAGIPETMEAGEIADATASALMTSGELRHFGLTDSGEIPTEDDIIKVSSSNPAVVAVTDVDSAHWITNSQLADKQSTIDPQTTTYKLNALRAGTADITVTAIVDGEEKSATKTITVSGEAMEETISKKTASVSIVALNGGSVSTSLGNAIDNVALGTEVSATATADAGYKFAYWQNSNGNVVSTSATETFKINTNTSIKAYFEKLISDTDATVPVYFYNGNGEALTTEFVEKGKTFAEVTKPSASLTGYVFENWSISDDEVITDVTRAVALFGESSARYSVNIIDGNKVSTQSGKAYGDEITVTASGDNFSYWMLGDDIVGYGRTLKIKVYGNMTLTAAYAGAKTAAPTVALEEANGSYFLTYSVPAGYTKIEAGIIFSKSGTPRVSACHSKAIERTGSGQFTAKSMGEGDDIARGYVMYTDGNSIFVIYAK